MKKFLLLIATVMYCFTASAVGTQPSVGDGSKGNPYQIATIENLLWFADYVNAGNTSANAILTADITMNTDVLDSNGDLNGDGSSFSVWTPIGGQNGNDFAGEFNGNGHTISGLYVNAPQQNQAALFGKIVNTAYIHDLGVKDSYFRGYIWVAGICADLASGKIENCWNGATVIGCHPSTCAGGIAGSCWKYASVSGCYNIGKISVESGCSDTQCGGICGIVARNDNVTYSVSNCVSLTGKCVSLTDKCEKAYNVYTENSDYSGIPAESYETIGNAKINNVTIQNTEAFESGEVCWILNGKKRATTWRQQIGKDSYPVWTGDYLVTYSEGSGYYNETMCKVSEDHMHAIEHHTAKAATCTENGNNENWHCTKCDLHFTSAGCTTEMNNWEIPALGHTTEYRAQKAATCTEDGNIEHWHCTVCNLNYSDEACTSQITGDVVLPKIGHKNKQHYARVEATCLTDGNIEYWYCPDCKANYTDEACTASTTETTLSALGHDFTNIPYKTSTCTSEGYVEHWHCNRCQKDFNVGEEMASEEHEISGSTIIPCKESDAIVVGMGEGLTIDDCFTFTPPTEEDAKTVATVTFSENGTVTITTGDENATSYTISEDDPLETFFAHTFKLKANQDPDHVNNYYSTFHTSECAYKVPAEAKAYEGTVEKGEETDVLKLTNVGNIVHKGEPVILRAVYSDITLLPSCNKKEASTSNELIGVDGSIELSDDDYALSYGQNGVGFYLWNGKTIGDNKAYLHYEGNGAKGMIFDFNETPSGIESISPTLSEGKEVNIQGIHVGKNYKGIVIVHGKKYITK